VNKLSATAADNAIKVNVVNFGEMGSSMPKTGSTNSFLGINSIDALTTSLAGKIVAGLNGTDTSVYDVDESEEYSLKKLIMKIMDGSGINVITDDTTQSYLRDIKTNTQRN
jgi:hypothetical protein